MLILVFQMIFNTMTCFPLMQKVFLKDAKYSTSRINTQPKGIHHIHDIFVNCKKVGGTRIISILL